MTTQICGSSGQRRAARFPQDGRRARRDVFARRERCKRRGRRVHAREDGRHRSGRRLSRDRRQRQRDRVLRQGRPRHGNPDGDDADRRGGAIGAARIASPSSRATRCSRPTKGVTFGSLSIQNGGMQIRQAAATARQALLAEGRGEARRRQGRGRRQGRRRRARSPAARASTTRRSSAARTSVSPSTPRRRLKDPKDYTIVGKSVARLDIPDKVTGRFTYMQDFRRKGMLHARVIRPAGDEGDADVVERFRLPQDSGLRRRREERQFPRGARADRMGRRSRRAGRSKRRGPTGQDCPTRGSCGSTCATRRSPRTRTCRRSATPTEALKTPNAKIVTASYDFAIHTHGSIGPSCAVAEIRRRQADVLDRVAADASVAQADRDDARR